MSTQVGFYTEWRDLMRSWGFTVHEAAGWQTRDAEPGSTYLPGMLYIEHHDASTKLSGNWGALAYILANRLANIVTARDGQIMLCAAGVEWHAGAGSHPGIPTNGANTRSMGNEVCNSGSEEYDPRCTAAIIAGEAAWAIVSGRGVDWILGHKEWGNTPPGGWPGRKQDPRIDMNQRRAAVQNFDPSEEDMPTAKEFVDELLSRDIPAVEYSKGKNVGPADYINFFRHTAAHATKASDVGVQILAEIAGLRAAVTALAGAVDGGNGITAEEIQEAVETGIANAGAALRAVATVEVQA